MLNLEYGLLFFFIGMSVTIVGFFIAYSVATYKPKMKDEEENALTDFHNNKLNK